MTKLDKFFIAWGKGGLKKRQGCYSADNDFLYLEDWLRIAFRPKINMRSVIFVCESYAGNRVDSLLRPDVHFKGKLCIVLDGPDFTMFASQIPKVKKSRKNWETLPLNEFAYCGRMVIGMQNVLDSMDCTAIRFCRSGYDPDKVRHQIIAGAEYVLRGRAEAIAINYSRDWKSDQFGGIRIPATATTWMRFASMEDAVLARLSVNDNVKIYEIPR